VTRRRRGHGVVSKADSTRPAGINWHWQRSKSWNDTWNDQILKLTYPQLHSFAVIENMSVKSDMQKETLQDNFQLSLSSL
jgi:hypothetical protein